MDMNGNGFPEVFAKGLHDRLGEGGVVGDVLPEAVPGTKLHRFVVVAEGFRNMEQLERQSLVWRIADALLTREEQLRRISMIYTLDPTEASAA